VPFSGNPTSFPLDCTGVYPVHRISGLTSCRFILNTPPGTTTGDYLKRQLFSARVTGFFWDGLQGGMIEVATFKNACHCILV